MRADSAFLQKPTRGHVASLPWQEFIRDYMASQAISGEFFDAILQLVKAVTYKKPPALFSPLRQWDREEELGGNGKGKCIWEKRGGDAYKTIAVDVLADQVGKGRLQKLYYAGKDSQQIYFYLKKAVLWHLHGIADAHGARRLGFYQRVRSLLRQDLRFHYFDSAGGWGLVQWKGYDWEPVSQEILQERIRAVEVPRTRTCRNSRTCRRKNNSLPTNSEIEYFIQAFLESLGLPVALKELVAAACVHFNVYDTTEEAWPVRVDEESSNNDEAVVFEDRFASLSAIEAETRITIEKFLGKLPHWDLYIVLELFFNGRKLKDLARPGHRKSSVSNDFRRVKAALSKLALDERVKPMVEAIFRERLDREMRIRDASPKAERHLPRKQQSTKETRQDCEAEMGGD